MVRYGPRKGTLTWMRPSPKQGLPKRIAASAMGRWPYFAKIGLEKSWIARHG